MASFPFQILIRGKCISKDRNITFSVWAYYDLMYFGGLCLDLILGPETQLKIKVDFNGSNNFMSRNENTDHSGLGKSHGLCEIAHHQDSKRRDMIETLCILPEDIMAINLVIGIFPLVIF